MQRANCSRFPSDRRGLRRELPPPRHPTAAGPPQKENRWFAVTLSAGEECRVKSESFRFLIAPRASLFRWSDDNAAKLDVGSFAALQIYRAGQAFAAVQRATGDSRNLLVINYCLAVLHHRHASPNQRNVIGLPFVCLTRQFRRRHNKSINAAGVMHRAFVGGIRFDLYLVTSAQINAAVGSRSAVELHMQFEVFKFRVVDQFWAFSRSDQNSAFHFPLGFPISARLPSG